MLLSCSILKNWQTGCYANNCVLPMTAITELSKRTKKSGTEEVKSKLDFSSCSLDDNHVSFPQRALTLLSIFLAPYFR
jgi:hypothetical protein